MNDLREASSVCMVKLWGCEKRKEERWDKLKVRRKVANFL